MAVCCATVVDPKNKITTTLFLAKKPVEHVFFNFLILLSQQNDWPQKATTNFKKKRLFYRFFGQNYFVESSLFFGSTTNSGPIWAPNFQNRGPDLPPQSNKIAPKIALSRGKTSQITPKLPNGGKFTTLPPKCKEDQPSYHQIAPQMQGRPAKLPPKLPPQMGGKTSQITPQIALNCPPNRGKKCQVTLQIAPSKWGSANQNSSKTAPSPEIGKNPCPQNAPT